MREYQVKTRTVKCLIEFSRDEVIQVQPEATFNAREQISDNVLPWTATGYVFLTFELVLAVSKANKEIILPFTLVVSTADCCFQSCEDTERSFALITLNT